MKIEFPKEEIPPHLIEPHYQMVIRPIQEGEPDKELIQSYLQRLEVEKKLSRKEGRGEIPLFRSKEQA